MANAIVMCEEDRKRTLGAMRAADAMRSGRASERLRLARALESQEDSATGLAHIVADASQSHRIAPRDTDLAERVERVDAALGDLRRRRRLRRRFDDTEAQPIEVEDTRAAVANVLRPRADGAIQSPPVEFVPQERRGTNHLRVRARLRAVPVIDASERHKCDRQRFKALIAAHSALDLADYVRGYGPLGSLPAPASLDGDQIDLLKAMAAECQAEIEGDESDAHTAVLDAVNEGGRIVKAAEDKVERVSASLAARRDALRDASNAASRALGPLYDQQMRAVGGRAPDGAAERGEQVRQLRGQIKAACDAAHAAEVAAETADREFRRFVDIERAIILKRAEAESATRISTARIAYERAQYAPGALLDALGELAATQRRIDLVEDTAEPREYEGPAIRRVSGRRVIIDDEDNEAPEQALPVGVPAARESVPVLVRLTSVVGRDVADGDNESEAGYSAVDDKPRRPLRTDFRRALGMGGDDRDVEIDAPVVEDDTVPARLGTLTQARGGRALLDALDIDDD
jgi:hypothetical protein